MPFNPGERVFKLAEHRCGVHALDATAVDRKDLENAGTHEATAVHSIVLISAFIVIRVPFDPGITHFILIYSTNPFKTASFGSA